MTKKIAFIGIKGLPSKAGVDRVVEAIVLRMDATQYEPIVYCSGREVPEETQISGVKLLRMAAWPGKHLHATSLYLIAALHALFFGHYDLIHVHNVEACYVLPLLRLRYKVISTSHGAAQMRDKWGGMAKQLIGLMELPFILFSNAATSVSQPLAGYYEQRYKRPIHYLPNGVAPDNEVDLDAAHELLAKHGVTPGRYILFAAGRILSTKGCHLVVEAFRQLPTDMKLVIVGDLSHNPAYEQQLRALADERVCFINFVSEPATLFGLVQAAHLFVFPSLVEAMSMMLLEVASLGAPLICSDIPENTSILPQQTLFFRSDDAQDLREKLAWALAHPDDIATRAKVIQNWVKEKYRWDDIVREYERLYAGLHAGLAVA